MPATCNMTTSRTYTCKAQATHLYSEMLLLTAASTFLHIPFRCLLLLLLLCVRIHAFIHDFIFFLQLPSRLFICFCFFFCAADHFDILARMNGAAGHECCNLNGFIHLALVALFSLLPQLLLFYSMVNFFARLMVVLLCSKSLPTTISQKL